MRKVNKYNYHNYQKRKKRQVGFQQHPLSMTINNNIMVDFPGILLWGISNPHCSLAMKANWDSKKKPNLISFHIWVPTSEKRV